MKQSLFRGLYFIALLFTFIWTLFRYPVEEILTHQWPWASEAANFLTLLIVGLGLFISTIYFTNELLCKKSQHVKCYVLQGLLVFSLLLLIHTSSFWAALLLWFFMAYMFYLFYDIKEKNVIYARVLWIGILSGLSVFLHPTGWAISLLAFVLLIIWAVLTIRTVLIFLVGWILPTIYLVSLLFFTDALTWNNIHFLFQIPSVQPISTSRVFISSVIFLLFNLLFWSVGEYKISTRRLLFNHYVAFLIGVVWFLFIKSGGIALMTYPFWVIYHRTISRYEKGWMSWSGVLLPLITFLLVVVVM